jgi:predicted RNA-binding Zn ribbon-like protein
VRTGQWFVSPEGTRWFFDAGAHSLDLMHTWGWGLDKPDWERLGSPAELGAWLSVRYGSDPAATADDLALVLRLRSAVTRAVLGTGDDTDRDTIDAIAARPDIAPQLTRRTPPTVQQAIATLARDAVRVLGNPGRIRECGADDCPLRFYDDSRAGTRRWCSMKRCGNRAKVRAHRHRLEDLR